jgi:hypothetical protein
MSLKLILSSKILFGSALFFLFSGIGNAFVNRPVWLNVTEDQTCQPNSLASFELGSGKRLQLLNAPNSLVKISHSFPVVVPKGNLLVFTEGPLLQPLDEMVQILHSEGRFKLMTGPKDSLKSLHTNASLYVKIFDPNQLEPQGCGAKELVVNHSGFRERQLNHLTIKRQPFPFAPLSMDFPFLIQSLREFSGDIPFPTGRILERGSVRGREAGQTYLKAQFAKLGLRVEEQCFTASSFKGCNVIGIMPGKTDRVVVVSAHADSEKNAGADDDGSGIAALIAIAKSMGGTTWNSTLHFVGFDLEEKGLLGSKAYVKEQIKLKTSLKGNINLEMLGYDSDNDGVFHVIDCKRKESQDLVNLVKQSVSEKKNLKATSYCTNRSDHASFWNVGVPAVVISQNFFGGDGNPCYHAACDKFDKINPTYLSNLTDLAGSVIAKFSESN